MRNRVHVALALSFVMSLPLFGQTEVASGQSSLEKPVAETAAAAPRRLQIISEAQTQNYIPKFDTGGATINSILYESSGKIGIDTIDPKVKLHVWSDATSDVFAGMGPDPSPTGPGMAFGYSGSSFGRGSGFFDVRADALATGVNPSLRFLTVGSERMIITNAGKVGIGTNDPTYKLHVVDTADVNTVLEIQNTSSGVNGVSAIRPRALGSATSFSAHGTGRTSPTRFGNVVGGWSEILTFDGNGLMIGTNMNAPLILGTNAASRIHVTGGGDVGIGTSSPTAKLHVVGNVVITGNITGAKVIGAVYQDLAEWVPATSDMAPGTVVVLNPERENEVMPSSRQYDTTVAGVVSAAPGIILGLAGDSKEQVATTGRVKVRVDARSAPVKIGDLLVTSDVSGTAMRSQAMDINGRKFHQPGTIIGKALEPLHDGVAEILVLLSLQ